MNNEKLFKYLDEVEDLFDNGFINLDEFYKIKCNIIDYYKNMNQIENDSDLPF